MTKELKRAILMLRNSQERLARWRSYSSSRHLMYGNQSPLWSVASEERAVKDALDRLWGVQSREETMNSIVWQPDPHRPSRSNEFANTAMGQYKIKKRAGRLILTRDGMVIGIHSSITDLRRIAEFDLISRSNNRG